MFLGTLFTDALNYSLEMIFCLNLRNWVLQQQNKKIVISKHFFRYQDRKKNNFDCFFFPFRQLSLFLHCISFFFF